MAAKLITVQSKWSFPGNWVVVWLSLGTVRPMLVLSGLWLKAFPWNHPSYVGSVRAVAEGFLLEPSVLCWFCPGCGWRLSLGTVHPMLVLSWLWLKAFSWNRPSFVGSVRAVAEGSLLEPSVLCWFCPGCGWRLSLGTVRPMLVLSGLWLKAFSWNRPSSVGSVRAVAEGSLLEPSVLCWFCPGCGWRLSLGTIRPMLVLSGLWLKAFSWNRPSYVGSVRAVAEGFPLEPSVLCWFCPGCGWRLPLGTIPCWFCPSCGWRLSLGTVRCWFYPGCDWKLSLGTVRPLLVLSGLWLKAFSWNRPSVVGSIRAVTEGFLLEPSIVGSVRAVAEGFLLEPSLVGSVRAVTEGFLLEPSVGWFCPSCGWRLPLGTVRPLLVLSGLWLKAFSWNRPSVVGSVRAVAEGFLLEPSVLCWFYPGCGWRLSLGTIRPLLVLSGLWLKVFSWNRPSYVGSIRAVAEGFLLEPSVLCWFCPGCGWRFSLGTIRCWFCPGCGWRLSLGTVGCWFCPSCGWRFSLGTVRLLLVLSGLWLKVFSWNRPSVVGSVRAVAEGFLLEPSLVGSIRAVTEGFLLGPVRLLLVLSNRLLEPSVLC